MNIYTHTLTHTHIVSVCVYSCAATGRQRLCPANSKGSALGRIPMLISVCIYIYIYTLALQRGETSTCPARNSEK